MRITFYTICNEAYFPGLVALINSLVLTGHNYPVVIGDCGMNDKQRALVASSGLCSLFKLDPRMVWNPMQYKAFAHIAGADGVVVMIDSDMIVTGSLEPIIARARAGHFCAFANPVNRWFGEWQSIFNLSAPPRRQTYVCTGFVAFSTSHWPALLGQWWDACRAIAAYPTFQEGVRWDAPTAEADQAALNAILMSEYPEHRLSIEPTDEQVFRWDFALARIVNQRGLECSFRGRKPVILHASHTPKPWQPAGARRDIYFQFLRRLLLSTDIYIKPPADMLNHLTAAGWRAWLARHIYFLRNMGLGRLLLSYSPVQARRFARQAQNLASRWQRSLRAAGSRVLRASRISTHE